jgi:hypothetical protein
VLQRRRVHLSRGDVRVNLMRRLTSLDAALERANHKQMTMDSTQDALARIEHALVRIEAATRRTPPSALPDARYDALRTRTQAALASLETVIAQAETGGLR